MTEINVSNLLCHAGIGDLSWWTVNELVTFCLENIYILLNCFNQHFCLLLIKTRGKHI